MNRAMVVGLGIDVASVARIKSALDRFGSRLWERVLAPIERDGLAGRADRAEALAGRFAAKEAASKALGAPGNVGFHDLVVVKAAGGAPELRLEGAARACAERLGVVRTLVSISHDAGFAAAVVVLEASEPQRSRR